MLRPIIGVNLLFLRPGTISGTATYSWSLLEELAKRDSCDLVVFCQGGASNLRSGYPNVRVVPVPVFPHLALRIAYEQTVLPLRASRHRVHLMFNPGYVSVLWGGFRRVVTVHDLYYKRHPWITRPLQRLYQRLMVPASVLTAHAIIAALDDQDWSPATIRTLIGRLVKKGALRFDKSGREYLYSAIVGEEECIRTKRRSFVRRVYGGAVQPMVAHLLEDEELSPEELDALHELLEKKRRNIR